MTTLTTLPSSGGPAAPMVPASRVGLRQPFGAAVASALAHVLAFAVLGAAVLRPMPERNGTPPAVALVFAAARAPAAVAVPDPPSIVPDLDAAVTVSQTVPIPDFVEAAPAHAPQRAPVVRRLPGPLVGPPPAMRLARTGPQARSEAEPPMAQQAVPLVSPDLVAGLKAGIQRSVQEAAVYPPTARMMHRQGRTQIRFDWQDGGVEAVSVAQSSQSPVLDHAALEAVEHAAYPKAPEAVKRTRLALLVWVNFGTVAEN